MDFYWVLYICICLYLYIIAVIVFPIAYIIYQWRLQRIENKIEQAEYEMGITDRFVPCRRYSA